VRRKHPDFPQERTLERTQEQFPITDKSVLIGMPVNGSINSRTVMSLVRTVNDCAKINVKLEVEFITGCSVVTMARSRVVDSFLKTDYSRLFWIDSDIAWRPEDFLRLLALTEVVDVVGALYPMKSNDVIVPTAFSRRNEYDMNKYGLLHANGLGLGFCVMKREVVEKVAATKPKVIDRLGATEMADVFRLDTFKGYFRGEDMAFFADIRELGVDVWVDPTVRVQHIGEKAYSENIVKYLGLDRAYADDK
jgi:hypothetical protein